MTQDIKNKKNQPTSLAELISSLTVSDLTTIASRLSEAAATAQTALSQTQPATNSELEADNTSLPASIIDAYAKLGAALTRTPDASTVALTNFMQGWSELFGELAASSTLPDDRRFSDPEWHQNPNFDLIRRIWALNTDWMKSLVDLASDELSEPDRKLAAELTDQLANALSPTNFLASNPVALRTMLESRGQSVIDGLDNFAGDIKRGGGKLAVTQSDESAFELGTTIAATRGQVIFRNDLIEIIHYAPAGNNVYARPILIFPPWINKFYILDLRPENSLVNWLQNQGANTFIVSWRSADQDTKDLTWDDYIECGIYAALDAVLAATGQDQVNAAGYCIGGTLLTSALAHMSKHGDRRIASATLLASQADFANAGELKTFLAGQPTDYLERVYQKYDGIMPGEIMSDVFNWLRPTDLVWRYYVDNYLLGKQPEPFDILFWNADQTNIPGPLHRTYMQRIFDQNELSKGEFEIFGETISPTCIDIPVYVQASEADHICPWQSVYKGAQLYAGDVTFTLAGAGHTAGVINPPVAKKYQFWQHSDLEVSAQEWRRNAAETAGSWWPNWWSWLQPLSGHLIPARAPADVGLGPSPGQFVRLKLDAIAAGSRPDGPFNSETPPTSTSSSS